MLMNNIIVHSLFILSNQIKNVILLDMSRPITVNDYYLNMYHSGLSHRIVLYVDRFPNKPKNVSSYDKKSVYLKNYLS